MRPRMRCTRLLSVTSVYLITTDTGAMFMKIDTQAAEWWHLLMSKEPIRIINSHEAHQDGNRRHEQSMASTVGICHLNLRCRSQKWKMRLNKFNAYIVPMFKPVTVRVASIVKSLLGIFWKIIWWNLVIRFIAVLIILWRKAVNVEKQFLKDLPHRLRSPRALLGPARLEEIRKNHSELFQHEITTGRFEIVRPKFQELKWRLFHTRSGIVFAVHLMTHLPFAILAVCLLWML